MMEGVMKTFELAMKLKKVMLKKGLRRARAKCPDCPDKFFYGALAGSKNHIRFNCDCGKRVMME